MNSDPPATLDMLEGLFQNAVGALIALAGIVLFIMLLMGGVKFITSGGDAKAVDGAKKAITYAIGGLVLILASYLILKVIGVITGAPDITLFRIVKP